MYIIGENIHIISQKVKDALKEGNGRFFQDLAVRQVEAGADCLDINLGPRKKDGEEVFPWLVELVEKVVDVPLSFDTTNLAGIEAGLKKVTKAQPFINSTSAEPERLEKVPLLAKKYNTRLIALTMGSSGIPVAADERVNIAVETLIPRMLEIDYPMENLVIDPLVLTADDALLNDALGEALSTLLYDTPPDSLAGLVTLANGILAGFVGNEICFCEPFQPHAWPIGYRLTVTEQIVALVAVGQGLYVLTEGHPYYCAGTHPDNMVLERITKFAPCMSKRSAATDGTGALYASYNGVTHLVGTQAKNITTALFTQEEWRTQSPESLYGIYYDDRYMLWYSATTAGPFTMNGAKPMDGSETMDGTLAGDSDIGGAMVFDSTLPEAPLTTLNAPTTAAHIRADDGLLYMVDGDELARFDADSLNKSMYEWRSKTFVLPQVVSMKAVQVYADNSLTSEQIAAKVDYEDALAQAMANLQANILLWNAGAFNAGWAGGGINEWEWNGSALKDAFVQVLDPLTALTLAIKVYADGDLIFSASVENNKPMLLPAGFKSDAWEIEVSGNKPVRRIVMGTSMAEVKTA